MQDFTRRDRALSFATGLVMAMVIWRTGTLLWRFMPLSPLESPVLFAFVYGAGFEETFKLLALIFLWRARQLRTARDFLPVATGIACGFASVENILALWSAGHPMTAFFQRTMLTLPSHMASAAIMADILAQSRALPTVRRAMAALVVAILAHGAYDAASLSSLQVATLVILAMLSAFTFRAWWRHRRLARPTSGHVPDG